MSVPAAFLRRLCLWRRALDHHGRLPLPRLPEGRGFGILTDRRGEQRSLAPDVRPTHVPQRNRRERDHRASRLLSRVRHAALCIVFGAAEFARHQGG